MGLTLFEQADGWRYRAVATNRASGALAFMEARHRATPGSRTRSGTPNTGLGRLPSRVFKINQACTLLTAIAAGLIAWLRLLALTENLAEAEPKVLRYRVLHVPARLTAAPANDGYSYPKTGPGPGDHRSVRPDHGHSRSDLSAGHHP